MGSIRRFDFRKGVFILLVKSHHRKESPVLEERHKFTDWLSSLISRFSLSFKTRRVHDCLGYPFFIMATQDALLWIHQLLHKDSFSWSRCCLNPSSAVIFSRTIFWHQCDDRTNESTIIHRFNRRLCSATDADSQRSLQQQSAGVCWHRRLQVMFTLLATKRT